MKFVFHFIKNFVECILCAWLRVTVISKGGKKKVSCPYGITDECKITTMLNVKERDTVLSDHMIGGSDL